MVRMSNAKIVFNKKPSDFSQSIGKLTFKRLLFTECSVITNNTKQVERIRSQLSTARDITHDAAIALFGKIQV